MASKHIHIGVFIPHGAQTLDVACVDVLGVMSQKYFSALSFIPPAMASTAPDVTVSFITSPSLGSMDVPLTSGVVIKATHLYTDEAVAPGKLDIVVVPGPDPRIDFDKGGLEWLKKQSEVPNVDVLSICTGIFLCAAAGVAEGKSASGPRGMQDVLKARFPGVKFVGEGQRWVQDGNLWSSGGVTNGNDLLAAYARSGKHWPLDIVEAGLALTEVGDRGQFYDKATAA